MYKYALIISLLLSFQNPVLAKPTGPVSIETNFSGIVEANKWNEIEFTIHSNIPIDNVQTSIRGIDGVRLNRSSSKLYKSIATDAGENQTISVKTDGAKVGYMVIDVKWEKDGQTFSKSFPISVKTNEAFQILHKDKKIIREEDGQVYKSCPATLK